MHHAIFKLHLTQLCTCICRQVPLSVHHAAAIQPMVAHKWDGCMRQRPCVCCCEIILLI